MTSGVQILILLAILLSYNLLIGLYLKELKKNRSLRKKQEQFNEAKEELVRKQIDFKMLQNQINPHFLYNTLESIRSEAELNDQEEIANIAESLANYFRYFINSHSEPVHLFEEIQNIKDYFTIIQFRFLDRISLKIDITDESIFQTILPRMTLQPLVENAINHGLKDTIHDGIITVSAYRSDKNIYLTVSDNGCGMSIEELQSLMDKINEKITHIASEKSRHGIALPNVNHRIQIMFGKNYGLTIESVLGEGTDITVCYPSDYKPIQEDNSEL